MRLAPLLLALGACGDAAPKSTAYRIGTLEDTIGGPHAIGTIGDFMLENDQVRFVIADTGVNTADPSKTTYGRVNTTFGGTLVDADIRRPGGGNGKGNDQLAELLPGFLFTVINPTKVEIGNDGSDGKAAEVIVTGTGGDLFQMVYLLNVGLLNPANLEFTNVYRLHPGARYVEIETTIKNKTAGAHPFPYLQPSELDALLGQNVPGVQNLRLSVPMGLLPLFGGEQDLFAPGPAGFNVQYAIEDTYKIAGGFPAFPGMVADFVATKGEGVSYGLAIPSSPNNYVNKYKDGYPQQDITPYSMMLPFTYAGVAGAYMYDPPAQLNAGQEFTFTSYFVVGDGDVASVTDAIYALRKAEVGSFGGRVVDEHSQAPVAKASVMILDGQGRPVNQAETDARGAFLVNLPPGDYLYTVIASDRLPTPRAQVKVAANRQATPPNGIIQAPTPATIAVVVRDEKGRSAPAKVQLVARFDPADQGKDPRSFLYSLALGEHRRPTAFDGGNRYVENAWWTKDGRLEAQVRPGQYELVVSRGPEYELTSKMIDLKAGAFVAEQLVLQRAYDTDGWVAGDYHIHAQPSTDSGIPIVDRVVSCAAEGLEVATATDHNYITDYAPAIAASGLDPWLLGIPGMELTTFEMGHFIGYPLRVDPGSTRGGEFVWANQIPQKLFDQLRALATKSRDDTVVQVAHPRQQVLGYWAQFFIDESTALPYAPSGILGIFAPYGDEFKAANYSADFDAVELLTGHRLEDIHSFRAPNPLPPGPFPNPQPVPGQVVVGADGRAKFPGTVETWMAMLDKGHRATGLGVSDTHGLLGKEPGYARTLVYVGAGKDTPGGFTRDDVVTGIRAHKAITTNAPFIEMTAADKTIGDTVTGANVDVRIRVRAPSWAKVDTLVVYSNSTIVQTIPIPAAQGTDFEATVNVRPTRDAWVVAEATGKSNMFPVVSPTELPPLDATVIINALSVGLDLSSLPLASNLKPQRLHPTTPYAITNPIWIDVDGNGWTPPKTPFVSRKQPVTQERPDVRTQFEAVQEIAP